MGDPVKNTALHRGGAAGDGTVTRTLGAGHDTSAAIYLDARVLDRGRARLLAEFKVRYIPGWTFIFCRALRFSVQIIWA